MHSYLLATVAISMLATPALAQVGPGPAAPIVVTPGAPGVASRPVGATGDEGAMSYSPTGQPADVISNDSAAAGNGEQPSRVAPQGGGGGGSTN